MAREVTHTEIGPRIIDEADIDEEEGDIAICLCGLSAEYPFCDGSHRATTDEESDTTYRYERDSDGDSAEQRSADHSSSEGLRPSDHSSGDEPREDGQGPREERTDEELTRRVVSGIVYEDEEE